MNTSSQARLALGRLNCRRVEEEAEGLIPRRSESVRTQPLLCMEIEKSLYSSLKKTHPYHCVLPLSSSIVKVPNDFVSSSSEPGLEESSMGNTGSWASNGWGLEEVDLCDWRSAASNSLIRVFNCCVSELEVGPMVLLGWHVRLVMWILFGTYFTIRGTV